jgi:hypothetical protein
MGFSMTLDESIVMVALQSFKELKSPDFSFEKYHPPWGWYPEISCSEELDFPRTPSGNALLRQPSTQHENAEPPRQ